jgi:hypothetical protein
MVNRRVFARAAAFDVDDVIMTRKTVTTLANDDPSSLSTIFVTRRFSFDDGDERER